MLILTRRINQKVLISHGGVTIEITLVRLRESSALLGFQAPDNVKILRDEVWRKDQRVKI